MIRSRKLSSLTYNQNVADAIVSDVIGLYTSLMLAFELRRRAIEVSWQRQPAQPRYIFGLPVDAVARVAAVLGKYPEILSTKVFGSWAKGKGQRAKGVSVRILIRVSVGPEFPWRAGLILSIASMTRFCRGR